MRSTRIPLTLLQWLPQGGDGTEDAPDDVEDHEETSEDHESDADEDSDSSTVSRAEHDALQRKFTQMKKQLAAADRNKSVAQQKLDELARQERTELENAQNDLKKAQDDGEGWKTRFLSLARTNAFLIASARQQITWHDPEVAQAAAKLDDLEVAEDGSVEGMTDVIKKLVKERPFLVNSGKSDSVEDTDTKPKSGSRVGAGGKAKDKGAANGLSPDELRKRFPALRV